MKSYKLNPLFLFSLLLGGVWSCSDDYLEPTLNTSKDISTSINSLGDLQGIVLGAYDRMNEDDYYGRDYIVFGEVRSDDAFSNANSGRFVGPGQFFLNPTDAYPTDTWQQIYEMIANANIVIQSEVENNDSPEVQYTKGQAYALRAMGHMDLLRLYGQQYSGGTLGVPIVTGFNDGNLTPERAPVDQVWEQIGSDLEAAAGMMDPSLDVDYSATDITTSAVYGLQSRYYLYAEDYEAAATAAETVISSGKFSLTPAGALVGAWSDGSVSTVFELANTVTDNPGSNGLFYMYQDTNYGDVVATPDLYNQYGETDVRRQLFTEYADTSSTGVVTYTYRISGKYRTSNYTDNVKLIRYAEVILNYAEALTQTGSSEALTWLNLIAETRGAEPYAAATIDNVLAERRKELAMEGFRFFDLMRYEKPIVKVDSRQTFEGGEVPFGSPLLAFPIPQQELAANPNIVQNEGYRE